MALTGIQIFKFLPGAKKTENANCKKCGCVTCMAYAMKLAKGEKDVNDCPYIDDELKNTFSVENRKPQIKVEFGKNKKSVIGDENVMFRHDKTFVNPCCYAIELYSNDELFYDKLQQISDFKITKIGKEYTLDGIMLIDNGDFENKAKILFKHNLPVILTTSDVNKLINLQDLIIENKPLIYLTSQNLDDIVNLEKISTVIVEGKTPEELSEKTKYLLNSGAKNIVLNLIKEINANIIEPLTTIRRCAIEQKLETLGFPVMVSYKLTDNIATDTINLSALVCKYTNLIIMNKLNAALLNTLITLKINIYTDPQKPLQVEPKLYEIGDVDENSQVIVTTNFALTYFAVANELESLSSGTYLIITDSGGMSVLTAWAASKFTGEIIAKAINNSGIKNKVKHNKIIIPGLVSDLQEELQEELPEFDIIVGTNEATDIPEFMRNL